MEDHQGGSVSPQNLHLLIRTLKTLLVGESLITNSNYESCLEWDSICLLTWKSKGPNLLIDSFISWAFTKIHGAEKHDLCSPEASPT